MQTVSENFVSFLAVRICSFRIHKMGIAGISDICLLTCAVLLVRFDHFYAIKTLVFINYLTRWEIFQRVEVKVLLHKQDVFLLGSGHILLCYLLACLFFHVCHVFESSKSFVSFIQIGKKLI